MLIDFYVKGTPAPDQRPRVARNGGIIPNAKTVEWKALVEKEGRRYMSVMAPLTDPLEVNMVFYMPIPESWSKTRKAEAAGTSHYKKPDLDNLAKAVMDGLNGIVWQDDAQIVQMSIRKVYSHGHNGVQITADLDIWG